MRDARERERGAHAFDTNLVVEAGAGSGKTSLLVERVLCQMLARGLDVDGFAAITFTEKAAAEMRKRLAAALAELAALASARVAPDSVGRTTEAQRAYAWLAREQSPAAIAETARRRLASLVGAEISTIHAFCSGLLRSFPLEAGVDPGFTVDTGLGYEDLLGSIWRDFLAGADGPGGARALRWRRVLLGLDLPELAELGFACASFALGGEATELALSASADWLRARAMRGLERIEAVVPGLPANGPESWLDAARVPLAALRDAGTAALRVEIERACCKGGTGRERGLLESPAPRSTKHPHAEALAKDLHRELRRLRRVDDALLADAVGLVRPFARVVKREARLRGVLPFDALLVLARDLLLTHPRVRRLLGERYRALFLDEFQDTDPLQYEIVLLLAEDPSSAPASDAFATTLARGKLFIVGDPKQAIYRFRGADVSAYQRAVAHVRAQGGEVLELVTCFRSVPELLAPLARIFPSLLCVADPELAYAYSGYSGLDSGREPTGETRVEVWTVGAGFERAEDARIAEASVIAGWVATEIAARRLAPKDVALLFRGLGDVHRYAAALQERGVPYLVGRSEELASEPAGQQILALLRALANPADAPAVLGVLRSALCAVPDAELARWAGRFAPGERRRAWSYPDERPVLDGFPNLSRAFALLAALREEARALAPERWLAALLENTPLLAVHALARDGERRVADLSFLIERLTAEAQSKPGCSLADLVRMLEGEERRPAPADSEEAPDRVRLISIHGAKGLEFPIVILPDLVRGAGGGRAPRVEVARLRDRGALAVTTRAGDSASWIEHQDAEANHARAEDGRLFYVACTRAEERLVFVHAPRKGVNVADSLLRFLGDWGYTKDGRPTDGPLPNASDVLGRALEQPANTTLVPPAPPDPPSEEPVARAAHAVARARDRARPPQRSPSGLREDTEARAATIDLEPKPRLERETTDSRLARASGTAIHDALERWDFRDAAALRTLVDASAHRSTIDESIRNSCVEADALTVANHLLGSDLPVYLASVDVIGRELPIHYRDESGVAWSGTIDLLYRDPDGRLVVADYKSDREPDDERRARYRTQLSIYARGVMRIFPDEPEPLLELIWLREGRRERLRLESPP
ncbi:MAG: UvrD-helicase domain-containing protein [Myxococcota bacterium]